MEGVSLVPAFTGNSLNRTSPIFFAHEGNRAVRSGEWKLVSKFNQDWELYHIPEDRSELNDLAAEHPARVQMLQDQWNVWAERAGVQPWPVRKRD